MATGTRLAPAWPVSARSFQTGHSVQTDSDHRGTSIRDGLITAFVHDFILFSFAFVKKIPNFLLRFDARSGGLRDHPHGDRIQRPKSTDRRGQVSSG